MYLQYNLCQVILEKYIYYRNHYGYYLLLKITKNPIKK
nr:MAG TPA: hypothetical protein [Caudoviricetes sp.]